MKSNRPGKPPASDVANPNELSEEKYPTKSEERSQPRTTSLGDSLERVLAAREALLRELNQETQGTSPTVPEQAVTPAEKPEQPTPDIEPVPAPAESAEPTDTGAIIRRLEAERADLASRLQETESEAEELRRACAERDRRIAILESRLSEIEAARTKSASPDEASAQVAEIEKKYAELAATGEQDRRQHVEEVATLTRQISELRSRYESQISEMTSQLERTVDRPDQRDPRLPGSNGNQEPPGAIETPAERLPAAQDHDEVQAPGLLIVDDSEIGQDTERRLKTFGFPTMAFRPDQDINVQFQNHRFVCMALNLGLPSTWRVLRRLRTTEATVGAPIVAYILAPRTETGYWFGEIDFVTLPLEYNDLIASLQRLAQPLRHVILIGMDDKLAGRVRNQLAGANVSVTAAQDRRNALDAVRGKYPQAAVVYPAQNPVDGFRAIAGVRGLAIFKDLPTVFLLDPTAMDHEDDRLSAGARTLLRLGALKPHTLIDLLASAMNTSKSSSDSPN